METLHIRQRCTEGPHESLDSVTSSVSVTLICLLFFSFYKLFFSDSLCTGLNVDVPRCSGLRTNRNLLGLILNFQKRLPVISGLHFRSVIYGLALEMQILLQTSEPCLWVTRMQMWAVPPSQKLSMARVRGGTLLCKRSLWVQETVLS